MRFIYNYPEVRGLDREFFDCGEISDIASAAEAAGFEGFALTEHPIPGANWLANGGHQTLDPIVGLAFAAAATQRIRLLTYLAVVPYRNPFLLAKSAATLDRCSNGRLVLGVGTGYHKTEFFALGVDFEERNGLFDEALDVLPKAWSGRPFDARGAHFDARGVIQLPCPAQDPIPIWIGGNSKLTRRRVAQHAQGWMPNDVSETMARTTRSPHIDSMAKLAEMIADVKDLAGPRAEEIAFCITYNGEGLDRPSDHPERHRERIGQLAEVGINWICVGTPTQSASETLEWVAAFGETYCPS